MEPFLLTSDELERLTGYAAAGWQAKWLRQHRWVFEINARGEPVVSRTYADSRLGGNTAAAPRGKTRVNLENV